MIRPGGGAGGDATTLPVHAAMGSGRDTFQHGTSSEWFHAADYRADCPDSRPGLLAECHRAGETRLLPATASRRLPDAESPQRDAQIGERPLGQGFERKVV